LLQLKVYQKNSISLRICPRAGVWGLGLALALFPQNQQASTLSPDLILGLGD